MRHPSPAHRTRPTAPSRALALALALAQWITTRRADADVYSVRSGIHTGELVWMRLSWPPTKRLCDRHTDSSLDRSNATHGHLIEQDTGCLLIGLKSDTTWVGAAGAATCTGVSRDTR